MQDIFKVVRSGKRLRTQNFLKDSKVNDCGKRFKIAITTKNGEWLYSPNSNFWRVQLSPAGGEGTRQKISEFNFSHLHNDELAKKLASSLFY